jgi:membrane protease subunit HflK
VKAVAESAMREVVGKSNIQPILTGARTTTETGGAGIDAEDARQLRFGHPGAAGADAEGRSAGAGDRLVPRRAGRARRSRALQNEAQTYANRVVPDAKGKRRADHLQVAEGYKQQAVAEAKGQSARFLKVYDEYKKAPDVTRQRIYLETMERILGGPRS